MSVPETASEAFDRGHVAGGTDARLADHDKHFAAINGNIVRMANEMHELTMAVQRLADQATARDATIIATANALRAADEARRTKSEQTWSPWSRIFVAAGALVGIFGVVLAIYTTTKS
jgi:hypothetical protein